MSTCTAHRPTLRYAYPQRRRYPWEKPREAPVTIALGIACDDGVVLGVDNEYSRNPIKTKGQKLFPIPSVIQPNDGYGILAAGSGNPDSVKKIVETIDKTLASETIGGTPTLELLLLHIENSIATVFAQHIDFAPVEQRQELHCDLLFAIWIRNQGTRLFRSNRTMLLEERKRACIGNGLYLAEYVMDVILPHFLSVEEAKCLAVYMIGEAKDYIEHVGGQSIVHTLHRDGTHSRLLQPEIRDIENSYGAFFEAIRICLSCVDLDSVPDDNIDLRLAAFKESILHFRGQERKRREHREARRRAAQGPMHPAG
jgi:20S proteasome alpha/beta subunit